MYTDRLQQIPWYGVLGNHDWYGNSEAQISFSQKDSKWVMPDHFYTRQVELQGGAKAAFIYIDTDLINYGYNCFSYECFLINFSKIGWSRKANTLESQFSWIESQLVKYNSYEYVYVLGHHNVVVCQSIGDMPRLQTLMEKYNVSAYMFGHHHSLGFTKSKNTMFVLSGAGGKAAPACSNAAWVKGNTYGFVSVTMSSKNFSVDFINAAGTLLRSEAGSPRQNTSSVDHSSFAQS